MGLFTPAKKHANKFRYTPRFFDPEKERREQRRRELHGRSSASDAAEYTPGEYLRTMREARNLSGRQNGGARRSSSSMVLLGGIALLVLLAYMLYPRIVDTFATARRTPVVQAEQEAEEFNPYAPITIVPNDYKEE